MTPRTNSSRVSALDDLAQGDNEVENVETAETYPPRLAIDYSCFAFKKSRLGLETKDAQAQIQKQIDNVTFRLAADPHFKYDPLTERVTFKRVGSVVYLRGKVKSGHTSRLVESVVGMQGGVETVVNEIEVEDPENGGMVDVFGASLDK